MRIVQKSDKTLFIHNRKIIGYHDSNTRILFNGDWIGEHNGTTIREYNEGMFLYRLNKIIKENNGTPIPMDFGFPGTIHQLISISKPEMGEYSKIEELALKPTRDYTAPIQTKNLIPVKTENGMEYHIYNTRLYIISGKQPYKVHYQEGQIGSLGEKQFLGHAKSLDEAISIIAGSSPKLSTILDKVSKDEVHLLEDIVKFLGIDSQNVWASLCYRKETPIPADLARKTQHDINYYHSQHRFI